VQCFAPSVELQQTPLGRPSGDANEPPASAKSLQVYSRRWRHNKKNHIQNEPATPCKDLERIMKPVEQLLPRPVAKRRCCKKTSAAPRRSRRVAGVKPCSPGPVTTDAQRKVIRSLGFTDKDEAIEQKHKMTTASCSRGDLLILTSLLLLPFLASKLKRTWHHLCHFE